jgi:hypothetical protein
LQPLAAASVDASAVCCDRWSGSRLHHQIVAQRVVIANIRPSQAKSVDALRQQTAKVVLHAGAAAFVANRTSRRAAQTQPLIDLPEQQNPAIADDVAAIERRFNYTSANAPEFNALIGTLWHRQSSVDIGGQIPMTTRLGTRLPTLHW